MIIDIENSNVQPVDYRNYQENKAGFIASLLSNNFIPYAQEVGKELFGINQLQDHAIGMYSI